MSVTLSAHESRVFGVLVEKALTTPGQYPLTLNAVASGSNQKSNRSPVLNLDEEQCLDALDGLRAKGLAREVSMSGSRVAKFRHTAREALALETPELVIVVELLLRGPQTVGEIRGHASRMHPLDSMAAVESSLDALLTRDPPLVRRVAAAPGGRAGRFAQLLAPDLHPVDAPDASAPVAASPSPAPSSPAPPSSDAALTSRVARLEETVARLQATIDRLTSA